MDFKTTALGIELGSTRIKAVLIDENHIPIASGSHEWENQLVNGIWTYSMEAVTTGIQDCYANLKKDVREKFGTTLTEVGAIGVSAMMHGYLPFDKDGKQLAEFRTWRNTITGEAAEKLSAQLGFNIPQRWSIAHLYQAILNKEDHVDKIAFLTTLAGYIHYLLTGKKVMGIGEASGMFPIDSSKLDYDQTMVEKFDAISGQSWKLREILPQVLCAGESGGVLTESGAKFLDPAGDLIPGIPVAPCEGDAGTGMAATNSVAPRTGNVSAGTSIFAMVVLERPLSRVYPEIDLVTTPAGDPVAMVHCNNCTSDLNAWVALLGQFAALCGAPVSTGALFTRLFEESLKGDADCGGVVPVNYYSGEGVTHLDAGRPLLVRGPESRFTLANLMRGSIYSAMATLKLGLDILNREQVAVDRLMGHGGLFKTPGVAQRYLAAAANVPVTCMSTAGEGGPYGMALLAAYRLAAREGCTAPLDQWLEQAVFAGAPGRTVVPDAADVAGFEAFMKRYQGALAAERAAVEHF